MYLNDYKKAIEAKEFMMRCSSAVFWLSVVILVATINFDLGSSYLIPLIGLILSGQLRVYWATAAAFRRGSVSAIEKGLTMEIFE